MSTWIALFRGINVGGHNKVPMAELSHVLEDIGLVDVRTIIQSGNVVFRSTRKSAPALTRDIETTVEKARGFRPAVLVLDSAGFAERLDANPFPEGTGDPKTLHLSFAASEPTAPDLAAIEGACSATERWRLDGDVFYLHAPDGIGRSKLAANVERWLGTPVTARNWRTLGRIRELLLLLLVLACLSPAGSNADPLFRDVSGESGLPGMGPTKGLIAADLDGDGKLDLLLNRHRNALPQVMVQPEPLHFVTADLLGENPGLADHHSTTLADVDGDGAPEIYLGCGADHGRGWGHKRLLTRRDGEWVDIADDLGVTDPLGRGRAALFMDIAGDPRLDLLVLNFRTSPRLFTDLRLDSPATDEIRLVFPEIEEAPPDPVAGAAPPSNEARERADYLYRLVPGYLDDDLRPEFLAWGRTARVLRFAGGESLENTDRFVPPAIMGRRPVHGLIADLNGDLLNDIYLVRGDGPHRDHPAYQNDMFLRAAGGEFVAAQREDGGLLDGTGWRVHAADFDNDGYLDLYILRRRDNIRDRDNGMLRGTGGGRFEDVTDDWGLAGFRGGASQDVLVCDLDADGDLDLVEAMGDHNLVAAVGGFRLFENRAENTGQHSIQFTLRGGAGSNPEAFGARMRVHAGDRSWTRDHWPTQCEGSSAALPVHFGLGAATSVDSVQITWPSGQTQTARGLPARGHWIWSEGQDPREPGP